MKKKATTLGRVLSVMLILAWVSGFARSAEPAPKKLPRVLILGDSIYRQPAADTAKALKGEVEVVFPAIKPGEVRHTQAALTHLDEWLGDEPWDLIHFNFGLGDLVYRAPGMKAFRVFPRHVGGVRATSPQMYERNLQELVKRLKASGAKLVWASTTPIRHSTTNVFEKGSEVTYNAIAARVMAAHEVPINDMHASVRALIDMTKPAGHGADPFFFDRKPLHPPIVEVIVRELGLTARREAVGDSSRSTSAAN